MKRKIFNLVSSPRSGSTVIYNAICSIKNFNPPLPESHLAAEISHLYYKQLGRQFNVEKDFIFKNNKDIKLYFKNCLNIFYNNLIERYASENLIIKSIKLSPNINVLHDFFPEIYYIFIIRDPRDIIVSMLRVSETQKKENIEPHFPINDFDKLCSKINSSYRIFLSSEFKDFIASKVHIIKYEDFVNKPIEQLNIFSKKFFKKNLYKNIENIWGRSNNMYTYNKKTYFSHLWGKKITTKKINEYKNFLKDNEINKICDNCKEYMNYFSYS